MLNVGHPFPCTSCPLLACPGLRKHSQQELEYIDTFKKGEVIADRGETILRQGSERKALYTVMEGILIRYRSLEDGRRQIVNFMFPGDLVGLQGMFDEPASHTVEALLPARLCVFDHKQFFDLIVNQPRLGYDITWLGAKEETALEEHIVALGRRSAKERVAYLAVWLLERAIGTCMAENEDTLKVPITQTQIADMLGLSLVHTNRTIKALERDGLVNWRQGEIQVPNLDAAVDFAQFERTKMPPRPFI